MGNRWVQKFWKTPVHRAQAFAAATIIAVTGCNQSSTSSSGNDEYAALLGGWHQDDVHAYSALSEAEKATYNKVLHDKTITLTAKNHYICAELLAIFEHASNNDYTRFTGRLKALFEKRNPEEQEAISNALIAHASNSNAMKMLLSRALATSPAR